MGRDERATRRSERISSRRRRPTHQAPEEMSSKNDLAYVEDDAHKKEFHSISSATQKVQPTVRASQSSSSRNSAAMRTMDPSKEKKEANNHGTKNERINVSVLSSHRDARRLWTRNDDNIEVSDDSDDHGSNDNDDDDDEVEERPGAVRVSNRRYMEAVEHGNTDALVKDEYDMESAEATLPEANVITETEIPIEEDEEFLKKAEKDAEAAFLSKVATAEVFDKDEVQKQRKAKQRRVIIGIVVIASIAIGVIVGISIALTGKDNNTSNGAGQAQSSVDPTTFDNITATSISCDGALLVDSIPAIITGSTADAIIDDSVDTCGSITANGAGVWYTLQGAGRPLSLSICFGTSYDTQISVYAGDSCTSPKCVEGDDQRTNCGRDGSQLTFLADDGTDYFILVHGSRRASGVFTLSIDEFAINNNCAAATRIDDVNPNGEITVFGSTKYSSVDDSLLDCFDTSITSPGVWYIFKALSTRFVQARVDDFSSKLTVFTGSCDSLQCTAASNIGRAMWTATAGNEYLIFVHGEGKQTADFSLTILPGGLLRPSTNVTNNVCNSALPVGLPTENNPTLLEGSTVFGSVADVPGCGSLIESSSKGLWYSVVGNGTGIRASTCDTDSGFVARVSVYQGDCLNLMCTDGGDQNCGDQSAVAWYGEAGILYYILVQGIDESRTGYFSLKLEEAVSTVSTDCNVPVPVILNGVSILGSSIGGTLENTGLCDNIDSPAPSVWYAVEGTGNPIVCSTCETYSTSHAMIEVYAGNCASRSCVADIEKVYCGDQMLVTWNSSPGETYLIQVYGSGSGIAIEERFTLRVEELPVNYICPGASTELTLGSSVLGSTLIPAPNATNSCSQDNAMGSWYKIEGNQTGTLTISACSRLTSFQPKLTLFQGDSCGQLVCIATNNNKACGAGSFLTWELLSSEVYFVLVQGGSPSEYGNFELALGPENDVCDSAVGPLSINGGPVLGSTLQATAEEGAELECFDTGTGVGGPGVWYTVLGNGALLKASTCSNQTTFDTQISVYEGSSCSELSCIAGNDNGGNCGDQSSVTWYGEQNKLYFLLIHGFEIGDFALSVSEVDNASCLDSRSVFLTGNTEEVVATNALGESFIDPCTGNLVSNQLGSWWTIPGTGGNVSINACVSDDSSRPASLSVYRQTCSDLTCQMFDENTCLIDFETNFLEEYTILVRNNLTNLGSSFEMDFFASNDQCEKAFGPLSVGNAVRGSTLGATEDDAMRCGEVNSRGAGVWYSFMGTGDTVTIFTCSEFTDFDTQLTLYKGDSCQNLTCIAGKQGNCGKDAWLQYTFDEGDIYYVLVSGKPGFSGNFVLQVA